MSTDRTLAQARRDAGEAVHALADAGRIAGGAAASSAAHGVEEARRALATAIDPGPAPAPPRTRRAPWILAVLLLTGLAAYAWAELLRRDRAVDPGTPSPTTPPSEDQIHGRPVGRGPAPRTVD